MHGKLEISRTMVRGGARAGVGVALAAGLSVGALGGTAAAVPPTAVTMTLTAVQSQHKETDVGTKGTSVGDRQVFSEVLYKAGVRFATDAVECVVTHVTKKDSKITAVDSHCVGTLRFGDGDQIAVQGLLAYNLTSPKPFALVVTGGTGTYQGATGQMTVTAVSDTKSKLALDITIPS